MKLGDFNYTKFNNNTWLITNYAGRHCFLSDDDFQKFMTGGETSETKQIELIEKYFMYADSREKYIRNYSEAIRNYRDYLFQGTGLHIFVLSSECNLKCVYCQASTKCDGHYMDNQTAEKAVDLALQSPSNYLNFEFQGGEPLTNFETMKHIVEYTNQKKGDKVIAFNLVSNLTLLTDEIIDFLKEYHITISTSLDGNETLQNSNRPYPGHNSYREWKRQLDKLRNAGALLSGAIETTTKASLCKPEEIVDAYIENGFRTVFLRPLTPLGYAAQRWDVIGYSAQEFVDFYRKGFDYIIKKAIEGESIVEGHAVIFLDKILNLRAGSYTELTSPCGAALGQLAYNYDGKIYTCDEGRMLAEMGDYAFQLGTVDSKYSDLFNNKVCKAVSVASCLESTPQCESCVYSPYCGTCPVLNYSMNKTIFSTSPNGYKCETYKGILDCIFDKLHNGTEQEKRVLHSWTEC